MKSDNVINDVIADRISDEILHVFDFLGEFRGWKSFRGDYHIVLFFIYLFSKNLLEKFLMNHYFNNLSTSKKIKSNIASKWADGMIKYNKATNTLAPFKNSDDLPSHVAAGIYNIKKINLKLNPCSNEEINIIIEKLSKENNLSFQKIYDEFKHTIDEIDHETILYIHYLFKSIEYNFAANLTDYSFNYIYEKQLKLACSLNKYSGEYMQPVVLTTFIKSYFKSFENLRIFNPCAGAGSFLIDINNSNTIHAQEINSKTWAIGQLRLFLNKSTAVFNCEDSIFQWPKNKKFDLIVSYPPFNVNLHNQFLFKRNTSIDNFILNNSINCLSERGKALFVLPVSTLFKSGETLRLREKLINEDLIDTIIHFPSGILYNTNIPFVVLILNKSKKERNKIMFVDSEAYSSPISKNPAKTHISLNVERILEAIKSVDKKSVRIKSKQEIVENNYNLTVQRYFQDEIKDGVKDGVKLKEILTRYRFNEEITDKNDDSRSNYSILIKPYNLKNHSLDFYLNTDELEFSTFRKTNVKKINSNCLLLSLKATSLKPTYISNIDETIYHNTNITPFRVNEDKVNINYLVNELHSPYVKLQIKRFRQGTTIPFIKIDDLLNVKIKLPSIAEQRAKVSGLKELFGEIKEKENKIEKLQAGLDSETYGNVSSVFHSLGTPITEIDSGLDNIKNILSIHFSDWKEIKVSKKRNITLKDSFSTIQSHLEYISTTLEKNKTKWDCSNYKLEEENFLTFIKNYIKTNNSLHKKNISTTLEINEDIKRELNNKILILANKQLLKTAFNCIVENADRHGFIDTKKNYKIKFNISLSSEKIENNPDLQEKVTYVKIEVSNNGKLFPDNFTRDELIRRNFRASETGNTGQGGYILNDIIKYFNKGISSLDIITDDPNTDFKTTYVFLIPLNL